MNIRMSQKLSEIDTEKENWDEEPIAAEPEKTLTTAAAYDIDILPKL